MKTRTRTKIVIFICAVGVLTAASVQAVPITYSYTGNPFNAVNGLYSTSDRVTGMVTLSMPLGDNFNGTVTPTAFSFTDDEQTLTNSPATTGSFTFTTGPTGAITFWIVTLHSVIIPTNEIDTIHTDTVAHPIDHGHFTRSDGSILDNPGTWASASTVPDAGSSIALLSMSLLALVVAARRFKPVAA